MAEVQQRRTWKNVKGAGTLEVQDCRTVNEGAMVEVEEM